ncbi:MAG: DUF1858 domain-containing protein [Candidatus Woesearchaeota archaeon]
MITKDMNLREVASKHPETLEIMFKYGMHCIGCRVAAFETIEQGAKAHGFDDKQLEKMLKEMNKVLENGQ